MLNFSDLRPPRGARLAGVVVLIVSACIGAGAYVLVSGQFQDQKSVAVTPPGVEAVTPEVEAVEPADDGKKAAPKLTPLIGEEADASFSRMAADSGGTVGVSVVPLGRGAFQSFGNLSSGHAWSVMKVPVLVTLLRERGGPDGLSSRERSWAAAALTQSDNAAAKALFGALESSNGGLEGASDALQQTLRDAGDDSTVINTTANASGFTTFGQTEWSAKESARFFRAVANGCLLEAGGTDFVLNLMQQVVGGQRWGMGSVPLGRGPLALKGGWGPEDGGPYLVRQSAIVGSGSRGYVVSIIAQGSGSFESGIAVVNEAAAWVANNANHRSSRPVAGCQ